MCVCVNECVCTIRLGTCVCICRYVMQEISVIFYIIGIRGVMDD